ESIRWHQGPAHDHGPRAEGEITRNCVRRLCAISFLFSLAVLPRLDAENLAERYLEEYFRTFPTRATEAGRHDFDLALEDLSPERLTKWVKFNRTARAEANDLLQRKDLSLDDRLDAEALLAQVERELHEQSTLHRPQRDPLYWSGIVANATVFLLVRDDLPLEERQKRARARARLLPRLADQARATFEGAKSSEISAELCEIAARQLRASSTFYKQGFPEAAGGNAEDTAEALAKLAEFFEQLARKATGSPRLGSAYAATFRVGTGIDEPVENVLARAVVDLVAKKREAAEYGRQVWPELLPEETPPREDSALLRRLFERVAADRDSNVDEYFATWQAHVREVEAFVREKRIITLPDPLTLIVDRSPAFFVGQSVGGVYPSGPYAPEAKTILFLPMPPPDANEAQRDAFFRDFNRSFNRMIVPHELIPGHYVQLKFAARDPHKIRAVFPDPIYVEGWGTFCERLLLDEGWGGALPRLAHLKKQLENIARCIVDIRVHTEEMSREEVIRFVKEDALQDDQFARNMWTRTITSSPQITTYYLGYTKVRQVYDAARAKAGEEFELQKFMDGMMELGPVRLEHYLARVR
ncbi:MAG TPA: DUF885 family protein, partial [Chthoniobacterales bacterium]|nr:DUF885 family protein [Chthoniobacterales bacterium]